jgi:uncharacterized protein (DUF1501 family)
MIRRRDFLQNTISAIALGGTIPELLQRAVAQQAQEGAKNRNVLVVVTLAGGNDGLNTVVPFENDIYYKLRPTIAHGRKDVRPLDGVMALHPSMKKMEAAFKEGRLAIVQSVGYPSPNRSHFYSMDVWQSGDPELKYTRSGWLGRVVDQSPDAKNNPLFAMHLGEEAPRMLLAESQRVITLSSLQDYTIAPDRLAANDRPNIEKAWRAMVENPSANVATPQNSRLSWVRQTAAQALNSARELREVVNKSATNAPYPNSGLAGQLKLAGQIAGTELPVSIISITMGGFDTHANEKGTHASLWQQIDDALAAFHDDLKQRGCADRVAVLLYSEFGRRVAENGSAGTDHGAAGPLFLFGTKIKGGLYGDAPDLAHLDDGDVKYKTDFRRVYATILDRWHHVDSKSVLGAAFEPLECI